MWNRLKQKLVSTVNRRASQEQADLLSIFMLTGHYAGVRRIPEVSPDHPDFAAFFDQLYRVSYQKQQEFVADQALEQVFSLFDAVRYVPSVV